MHFASCDVKIDKKPWEYLELQSCQQSLHPYATGTRQETSKQANIRLDQFESSEQTGCNIYGKCEFLNPGGSIKDRAALQIIKDALKSNKIKSGGTIVEGTAGNTGIGLSLVGNSLGMKSVIVIPKTQSEEKKDMLRLCGADLREVEALPYKDPGNYVRYSETLAKEIKNDNFAHERQICIFKHYFIKI